ncbi:MAG: hypothetical protein JWM56_702 [Candidatus Peribacteria bacterium]|nr:hypothetical protein [Candidatus Peribacteria bacterium]
MGINAPSTGPSAPNTPQVAIQTLQELQARVTKAVKEGTIEPAKNLINNEIMPALVAAKESVTKGTAEQIQQLHQTIEALHTSVQENPALQEAAQRIAVFQEGFKGQYANVLNLTQKAGNTVQKGATDFFSTAIEKFGEVSEKVQDWINSMSASSIKGIATALTFMGFGEWAAKLSLLAETPGAKLHEVYKIMEADKELKFQRNPAKDHDKNICQEIMLTYQNIEFNKTQLRENAKKEGRTLDASYNEETLEEIMEKRLRPALKRPADMTTMEDVKLRASEYAKKFPLTSSTAPAINPIVAPSIIPGAIASFPDGELVGRTEPINIGDGKINFVQGGIVIDSKSKRELKSIALEITDGMGKGRWNLTIRTAKKQGNTIVMDIGNAASHEEVTLEESDIKKVMEKLMNHEKFSQTMKNGRIIHIG